MGLLETLLGNGEGDAGAPPAGLDPKKLLDLVWGGGATAPTAPAPVTSTADPYSKAIQDLLAANTMPPKRRPVDYLLQIAAPIAQAFASAAMAPRRQAKKALIANLLAGGVNTAGDIVNRKRTDAEAQKRAQIQNILLAGQVDRLRPTRVPPKWIAVQDPNDPTKSIMVDENTGQPVPGGMRPPAPHITPQAPTTRQRTLESGDTAMEQWDPESKTWKPSMTEGGVGSPPLVTQGGVPAPAQSTGQVPFISKAKKEKPPRELREGSGGQYYWISPNEKPQPSGVFKPQEQREGDINRNQAQEESAVAFSAVDRAFKELSKDLDPKGPGADPQAVAKRAKELFRERAALSEGLQKRATGIHSAIDKMTKGVTSNEMQLFFAEMRQQMSTPKQ